jgi:AI-2 transport protein TqsA
MALAPRYQESLLLAIQEIAVFFHIETEPTWTTLRQDLLARINIHAFIGSMVASVSSLTLSFLVVALYAGFLLIERASFVSKIANLSSDPRDAARIMEITADINAQIGSYLAVKTLLGILLGVLCWVVMAFIGLDLAAFWAVLIALLNYVPYFGSVVGVFFPVLMAIVQFGTSNEVLMVLLPLAVIHFLIGNFLDPYLLAKSLNLSPFVILVSLTVWAGLWGIPGAFVAVPITAIMVIVFSRFAGTRPIAVLLSRTGQLRPNRA